MNRLFKALTFLILPTAFLMGHIGHAQAQTSLTRMSLHEAQLGLINGQKAITSGQYSEGIALLTRVLRARALPKDQAAQAFYDRGLAHQSLQDYEKASLDYSQALALNILTGTYRARALYNRGLARKNLQDNNGAMDDFTKAIAASPGLGQAYYQRGKIHSLNGQYAQAITDYKSAIARQMPSSEWAWLEMARAQGAGGQWALAQNALNSALQINPEFSQARQQLAIVQNNLQYAQTQNSQQQQSFVQNKPAQTVPQNQVPQNPQAQNTVSAQPSPAPTKTPQAARASTYTDPIQTNAIPQQPQPTITQQQTGQWDARGLTPRTQDQYGQIPPTKLTANQQTGAASLYVPGPGFDAARKATPSAQAPQPASTPAIEHTISGYIMQLSAHHDIASARQRWTSIYNKNTDILGGLTPVIQKSTSKAGAAFYRLRTGPFPKKADGDTLCQALKARGQDCFVTYVK